MVLDEPKKGSDKVFSYEALTVIIDTDLLAKLGSVNVDFRDSVWRSGFSVTAANDIRGGAASACDSASGKCC